MDYIIQLLLTVLLVCNAVSSYLHEHLCTCGKNANENIGVIDCVRFDEDGHTNNMLNTIYGTSQETCSSFSIDQLSGFDSCKMNNNFTIHQTLGLTAYDGTKVYFIQSPNYNMGRCYPPLTYCAHSVSCPIGSVLYYYNSFMDLTANSPHLYGTDYDHCTDSIEVDSYYNYYTRCGVATVPSFYSGYGQVLVEFASSKCCHSCGYAMWALCIPLLIRDKLTEQYKGLVGVHDTDTAIEHQKLEIPLKIVEVKFSSKLQYTDNKITIFEHKDIVDRFHSISKLHLYDEKGTLVTTFKERGKKDMYGYGILKLSEETAHYFEIGIPKKFVPTEDEKLFINHSLEFMTPYFMSNNSFDKIGTNDQNNMVLTCSDDVLELNSCISLQFPNKIQQKKILKNARSYKKRSNNPFVLSTSNLVIETLSP